MADGNKRPLFVFGGPYSNLSATRKVLRIARQRGFGVADIICTGDVVAYGGHPAETVGAVRDAGVRVVMGNCEESLGERLDGCGCGFTEGSACDMLSRSWFTFADSRIDDETRLWMRSLPHRINGTIAGRRFAVIHGHSGDISGWVFASTSREEKLGHIEALETDLVIAGHCGLPFIDDLGGGRLWLNAGVVGMPANDGTPRGWFATLTPTRDGRIVVSLEGFEYEPSEEIDAMARFGLPDGYREALTSGLWPNMGVLPEPERAEQGRPLMPSSLDLAPLTGAVS